MCRVITNTKVVYVEEVGDFRFISFVVVSIKVEKNF